MLTITAQLIHIVILRWLVVGNLRILLVTIDQSFVYNQLAAKLADRQIDALSILEREKHSRHRLEQAGRGGGRILGRWDAFEWTTSFACRAYQSNAIIDVAHNRCAQFCPIVHIINAVTNALLFAVTRIRCRCVCLAATACIRVVRAHVLIGQQRRDHEAMREQVNILLIAQQCFVRFQIAHELVAP